jgi:co-chaperonin GroES (HSP10)
MSNIRIKSLKPLNDYVLVSDMVFKERLTSGGIVLMGDDSKSHGVRPRWARVYAIGPEQKEVSVGQWICVAHGRWTRGVKIEDDEGVKVLRRVDNNDILLVSDEPVVDDTVIDSV